MTGSIDARDIHHIATAAELASKVLRDRGDRAWKRSADYEPGAPTSRPADATGGGTRLDDDGVPIVSADRIGDQVAASQRLDDDGRPIGERHERSARTDLADALRALDTAASRVVDLVDEITRTHTAAPPEDPRGWCPTCKAAGVTEPSAMRTDGSQRFRDVGGHCRRCIEFHAKHGFDRPALIIQRIAEGRKLSKTEADRTIARARREHELEQRKKAARAARRRAEEQEAEAS